MSREMVGKVSRWIVDNSFEARELWLHFLGGEPMIAFNKIKKIVDFVDEFKASGVEWKFGQKGVVFTNGDFLTAGNLREIKDRGMIINMNPTDVPIRELRKRIEMIKSICGGCSLAVALDDFNMSRIGDLARLSIEFGVSIRTNRLYNGGTIPGYTEKYLSAMTKLFDIFLAADKPIRPHWIMESIGSTLFADYKKEESYFVVIDPNGDIRSCSPDLQTKIGNIKTHTLEKIKPFTGHVTPGCHHWNADNLLECQDCTWKEYCLGGCPYTRKLYCGTYGKKTPFCGAFKALFPMLMSLKERWERKSV
jgi:radical SAM protein with 4Fe4S-binding SPASM domain